MSDEDYPVTLFENMMSYEDAGADSGSDMSYDSSVGSHSSLTGQFPWHSDHISCVFVDIIYMMLGSSELRLDLR